MVKLVSTRPHSNEADDPHLTHSSLRLLRAGSPISYAHVADSLARLRWAPPSGPWSGEGLRAIPLLLLQASVLSQKFFEEDEDVSAFCSVAAMLGQARGSVLKAPRHISAVGAMKMANSQLDFVSEFETQDTS